MRTGIVFDIKEFAVHDGPGIRTTVFLKGCPLRCAWCHNPEGLSPEPQVLRSAVGDRLAGRRYTSAELAALLNDQAAILRAGGGGVTFSGGEPLMQAPFVAEVVEQLHGLHVLLDTSGCVGPVGSAGSVGSDRSDRSAEPDLFRRIAGRVNLVFFDLKLMDPEAHRRWTGADNAPILRNLRALPEVGVPFVVRVPLVPGVTDTEANLAAIAAAVRGLPGLQRVDLLPYNRVAGGKYRACGLEYHPGFDEDRPVNADTAPFEEAGVPARVC